MFGDQTPLWHLEPIPVFTTNAIFGEMQFLESVTLRPRLDVIDEVVERLLVRLDDESLLFPDRLLLRHVALLSGGIPRLMVSMLRTAVLHSSRGRIDLSSIELGAREVRQDLEDVATQVKGWSEGRDALFPHTRVRPDSALLTSGAMLAREAPEGRVYVVHPLLFPALRFSDALDEARRALN